MEKLTSKQLAAAICTATAVLIIGITIITRLVGSTSKPQSPPVDTKTEISLLIKNQILNTLESEILPNLENEITEKLTKTVHLASRTLQETLETTFLKRDNEFLRILKEVLIILNEGKDFKCSFFSIKNNNELLSFRNSVFEIVRERLNDTAQDDSKLKHVLRNSGDDLVDLIIVTSYFETAVLNTHKEQKTPLDCLEKKFNSRLQDVQTIYISGVTMERIPYKAFRLFSGLKELRISNCELCDGVGIRELGGCLPSLERLDLSLNRFKEIPDIYGFMKLEFLDLSSNTELSINDVDDVCLFKSGTGRVVIENTRISEEQLNDLKALYPNVVF